MDCDLTRTPCAISAVFTYIGKPLLLITVVLSSILRLFSLLVATIIVAGLQLSARPVL